MRRRMFITAVFAAVFAVLGPNLQNALAVVAVWEGDEDADWFNQWNWEYGVMPTSADTAHILGGGYKAVINGGSDDVLEVLVDLDAWLKVIGGGQLSVGADFCNGGGTVEVTNATLEIAGELDITIAADGLLKVFNGGTVSTEDIQNAGSIDVGTSGLLYATNNASSHQTITVHDGGTMMIYHDLENHPHGIVTVEDASSSLSAGLDYTAHGTTDVSGGGVLTVGNMMYVDSDGVAGEGQVNLAHAKLYVNNQLLIGVGHPGTVLARRSTVDVFSLLAVGSSEQGTLRVGDGSTVTALYLYVGDQQRAEGDLILDDDGGERPWIKMDGPWPEVVVGNYGTGTVIHNAGQLTRVDPSPEFPDPPYPDLVLGNHQGVEGPAVGVYNFNAGRIHVADMTIGNEGNANFIQRGGAAEVNNKLSIATGPDSVGVYQIEAGSLDVPVFRLGGAGEATATQRGGLVTVDGQLRFANLAGSTGTYNLNDGTLRVGEIQNGSGVGSLNVDGGTLVLNGTSITGLTNLRVGHAPGSVGSLTLDNKDVTAHSFVVGDSGEGTFNMSGGIATGTVAADAMSIGVDNLGTVDQTGGHVAVAGGLIIGVGTQGTGAYTLDGKGWLDTDFTVVGEAGIGTFIQTGGEHRMQSDLYIGKAGNASSYYLGGTLSRVIAGNQYIGHYATATFTQDAGINRARQDMYLGYHPGAHGTYQINGGHLVVKGTLYVGYDGGSGDLEQNGGTVEADIVVSAAKADDASSGNQAGTLVISNPDSSVTGFGTIDMDVENSGLLRARGGTLELKRTYTGGGNVTVSDGGTLLFHAGGEILGPLVNDGTIEVAGGGLSLGGSGTSTGTFQVGPGAVLEFSDGGTFQLDAGTTVRGAGEVSFGDALVTFPLADHTVTVEGDVRLGGQLALSATRELPSVGLASRTILTAAEVIGTFAKEPDAGDYLGCGVFLTARGPHGQGITYNFDSVEVDLLRALSGDTDGDIDIDPADLARFALHWDPVGVHENEWPNGDFDLDGDVDPADLAKLAVNWAPAGYLPEGAAAVPEPGAMVVLGIGGLCLLGYVWRRKWSRVLF